MEVEKSYIEIKITFIHIVVLLVGVIMIGVFLFYLGYQSGKSAVRSQILQAELPKTQEKSDEIRLADRQDKKTPGTISDKEASISDEIKLHQLPPTSTSESTSTSTSTPKDADKKTTTSKPLPTPKDEDKETIVSKPLKKEAFYSVQVGAFADYANAKNYAAKFAQMGYPTEINTIAKKNKNLHRVRVGNFKTQAEATREKQRLEKMENRKFAVINPE